VKWFGGPGIFKMDISPLDLYQLFVVSVFGSFWFAVVGLVLTMFIIMGVLGRISIYTCSWYSLMFVLAMGLGYGYILVNIGITLLILIGFIFGWRNYFDK